MDSDESCSTSTVNHAAVVAISFLFAAAHLEKHGLVMSGNIAVFCSRIVSSPNAGVVQRQPTLVTVALIVADAVLRLRKSI